MLLLLLCAISTTQHTHIFYGGFGIYIPLLFCRYFGMPVSCLVLFVEMNGGPFGWLTMLTEREKERDFADSILYFVVVDGGRCPRYYSTVVAVAAAIVVHASTL